MFRPIFERLENREVLASSLGLSLTPEILPVVDPLLVETANLRLASKAVATGDLNTDSADLVQVFLPYIEQDNLYKQVNSVRGDRAFISQLSQDLLGRASDTPHDAAFNQLGLASDGRFGDLNRPQGIIAILIG
jgi:hypothetical protein